MKKKVLMVIAPDQFRDEEYLEPRRILEVRGCAVTVASTSIEPATGMLGAVVKPDTTIDKVKAADFDAVVFVGGAEYTAKPVEQDGSVITADGPASAEKFGEAIAKALGL